MKKLLFFVSILAAFVTVVSCNKESSGPSAGSGAVTGEVSHISCRNAEISGKANISGSTSIDLSFGVLYSTSSGILIGSATKIEAKTFDSEYNFTVNTDVLEPETTYYYRSYIIQNSEVSYGEVKSFKTLPIPAGAMDLGLSVLWATCNVGASNPEEYGTYFAWGDVTGQTWNGSSWSGGGFSSYPNYELDANGNLNLEYDAAHVKLGGSWRMPTKAEWQELIDNCTYTWASDFNGSGAAGRIFTSKKEGYTDKSIFLPAAGYGNGSDLYSAGSGGIYWSGTFRSDDHAWYLHFYSGTAYTNFRRSYGQSVRPVAE